VTSASPPRVLVADDDASVRDLLSRALRGELVVMLAQNGAEAIEALKTTAPDAILVDEMMPGATGTEVLRAAKALMPDVPRMLMTASSDPSAAMRAVNHGEIHRFYTKPLRLAEVRRAIVDLVDRARADVALHAELRALQASKGAASARTRVAVFCEGEIGERCVRAAARRGFDAVRAIRLEALEEAIGGGCCDVVVIDVDKVGVSALAELVQLARRINDNAGIVFVDQRARTETLTLAFTLGVSDCLVPPYPEELLLSVRLERAASRPRERAELRRLTYELVISNRDLEVATRRVEEGQVKLLAGLMRALEARDPYTAGHTDRVAGISVRCGEVFGLTTVQLEVIRVGAMLHDIGKIGIRDDVLYKPGRLTPEEFEVIKTHTTIGGRILNGIESLSCAVPMVRGHHERPDGKGYPDGISSLQLPLEVRIVSGADVLDAITSTRPYRTASTLDEGLALLDSIAGTQLDADVVKALRTLHVAGRLSDLTQGT